MLLEAAPPSANTSSVVLTTEHARLPMTRWALEARRESLGRAHDGHAGSPARERLRALARFVALGPVRTVLCAAQYEALWRLNPLAASERPWSTWCASSVLGIAWIHAFHCRFTFRRALSEYYLGTLGRAYLLQGTSTVLGALAIDALARSSLHHSLAWILVSGTISLLNFAGLLRLLGSSP